MLRTYSKHDMLCAQIVFCFRTIYVQNMFWACSEIAIFMYWTCNSMNNLSSYYGLVDAKIEASDKDLPVLKTLNIEEKSRENSDPGEWELELCFINYYTQLCPGKKKERKGGKRTTSRSFYDASFSFKVLLTVRKLHLFDCSNAKNWNS